MLIWWVQIPLAIIVCLLPKLSLQRWRKHRVWKVPAAMCAGALLLYAYYESGISAYTDIRVDLLIVGPAVLVSAAMLIFFAVKFFRRNAEAQA